MNIHQLTVRTPGASIYVGGCTVCDWTWTSHRAPGLVTRWMEQHPAHALARYSSPLMGVILDELESFAPGSILRGGLFRAATLIVATETGASTEQASEWVSERLREREGPA